MDAVKDAVRWSQGRHELVLWMWVAGLMGLVSWFHGRSQVDLRMQLAGHIDAVKGSRGCS